MPWRPPICPPRPTDGRGRCPGASGPPQTGGPAHQPGQLAPGAVLPCGLAGAGRGPAPPVPIAPPGAPSRCPAAADGFGGASAVCSRSSAPAPRLRAGPAHRAGPLLRRGRGCGSPFGGRGRGRFPPPPPALAYRRVRSPVAGPPGCPPPRPLRRLGAAAGRVAQLCRAALGWAPPPRPLRAALARPCCPPGGPVWGGPPCGCCGLALAGDPSGLRAPLLRAGGPLARCAGLLGRSAAPRLALPRRCAVGHPAPSLAAARQLARGAGKQGEYDPAPARS